MSTPVISVTPAAEVRITELLALKKTPLALRVYVVGGGCSGMQYGFKFDQVTDEDHIHQQGDVQVVVDPFSLMYLSGATVDFQKNLTGSAFTVTNPNATTTCSCGASFSVGNYD